MSERKYFWLKLKDDFFRQKEIKKLRSVAGGDTYTVIYLKLQLLSLQTDGVIEFSGLEDDFADELALEIDENADNVKFVLMYLAKIGWLVGDDEKAFSLPQTIKNIGSETAAAERMRKFRNVTSLRDGCEPLQICSTDIDIELEKEKDIELELKKEFAISPKSNPRKPVYEQSFFTCREILDNCDLSADEKAKIGKWLQHKRERKDKYTETGFKSLLTEYKNNVKQFGKDAVFKAIDQSTAGGYVGVAWDKAKNNHPKSSVDKNYDDEECF